MTDPSSAVSRLSAALADRYRIERELGQGGMATVYLAQDLKHDRKVAIKVLRPELAAVIGAERFLREIKTIANLQHPHILGLIDSGEVNGTAYYVMPFVEGESLRDRLNREKQLPIPDAIRCAGEVAAALDYAHRHGVIHRDIKPENVMLHDGSALVTDFGIALAVSSAGGSRMTETGMSLGTPHYMSPEQAMGEREITARSDVYALGAMTYEMLAGDPPFTGSTAQAIVAKVMSDEPAPLRRHRKAVPEQVEAAVLTALEKLPADRFATAAEFAAALVNRSTATTTSSSHAVPSRDSRRWRQIATGLAGALVIATVGAALGWMRRPSPGMVRRFQVTMSEAFPEFANPLLSPDGSRLIYSNIEGGLLLRNLDALETRVIPGSADAWATVFSPDSREIAINTGFPGAVKILPLDGGAVRTLVADSTYGTGLDWSEDGWIYYFHGENNGRDLMRIRATGGKPEFVARPDSAANAMMFLYPQALPGGRILLTVQPPDGDPKIGVVDPATGVVAILTDGVFGRYTSTGYLLVVDVDGTLQVARFDAKAGVVRGGFTAVTHGLAVWSFVGAVSVTVSDEGTLAYQLAPALGEVVRVDRDGREQAIDPDWRGVFGTLSLSPDGSRLAVSLGRAGRTELWVRSLGSGALTKLSSGGTYNYRPSWSPDGRDVIFTSDQRGKITTYRVHADGSSPPALLLAVGPSVDEAVYSADGAWIVYRGGSGGGRDIFARRTTGDTTVRALVASKAQEFSPALSPDGRWLAYASDESGQTEVYVRPFPDAGAAKFTISRNGGSEPLWNPTGGELFFRDGNDKLVAVGIAPGAAFRVTSSRALFSTRGYRSDNRHRHYSVSADGRSFIFVKSTGLLNSSNQLVVTLNWFEELRRKVGP